MEELNEAFEKQKSKEHFEEEENERLKRQIEADKKFKSKSDACT